MAKQYTLQTRTIQALPRSKRLRELGSVFNITGGGSNDYDLSVLRYIKVVNGKVLVTLPLGSTGDVFAKGDENTGGSSNIGTPGYDRLDRWADYTAARAGDVLSALLGYDLHTRVQAIENGQLDMTWSNISGKPDTFTPSAHNHTIAQVNGLQEALDGKVGVVAGKGLSTNDYTTAEKTKLAGLSNYIHPSFTARTISAAAGLVLSAIAINANGHVSAIESKTLVAADIPTLAISHISGLQSALDATAPLSHVGDISHLTAGQRAVLDSFSIVNGKVVANKPLGSTGDVFAKGIGGDGGGSIFNRLDSWADYTTAKAGYALSALLGYDLHTRLQTIETGQIPLTWDNITGKPATFTPSAHNHPFSQITGLQAALDGKQPVGNYVLASSLNDYLRLSGGTLTSQLVIATNNEGLRIRRSDVYYPQIGFENSGGFLGEIGVLRKGEPAYYNPDTTTWYNFWHAENSNKSDVDWNCKNIHLHGTAIFSPAAISLLNGSSAQRINTGGVLVSNDYSYAGYVPVQGIFARGEIISATNIRSDGNLFSTAFGNTIQIGSQNAGFYHIYGNNNVPFIFNNNVHAIGDFYGGTGYNRRLAYVDEANVITSTKRDFNYGTLIKTEIWYGNAEGAPFYLEIKGNVYGRTNSCYTQIQGYIYSNTIINYGVTHIGANAISGIVAMNLGGYLCFWFPRQAYWEGYSISCTTGYDYGKNLVTSIEDVYKPSGSKEVNLNYNTRTSIYSDAAGNVSISGDLTVANNIKAGGEVSNKTSSDEAFKTDPISILKGSDILKKLRPVEFTWNGLMRKYNPDKVGKSASFIAQEFGKVLPWAVSRIYEKYLAIDKEAVIPYLVSGWQEHESELNALKQRVLNLENEVKQLKSA